jgi:hypothetical protein
MKCNQGLDLTYYMNKNKSKYNKPSQLIIVLATSLKNLCGRKRSEVREWSGLQLKRGLHAYIEDKRYHSQPKPNSMQVLNNYFLTKLT